MINQSQLSRPFYEQVNGKKLLLYLDHTAFKQSACLRRLEFIIQDGLVDIGSKIAIEYGSAFHIFKKHLYLGEAWEDAAERALGYFSTFSFEISQKEFRTISHLAKTCARYYNEVFRFDNFKPLRDSAGEPFIEKTFAIPVFVGDSLEILLAGTVDAIGSMDNGSYVVGEDTKTTAVWNSDEFLRLFTLSSQLMFYQVACQMIGYSFAKQMSWRVDGIFLSPQGAMFKKSEPIFFSAQALTIYQRQIKQKVEEISTCVEQGAWPQNFLCCDTVKYDKEKVGMCPFFSICEKDNENDAALVKDSIYKHRKYEPLKFGKEKIA
jgi:hypothetical protein